MPSRYQNTTLLTRSQFGDLYRATDSETGAEVVLRRFFDAETIAVEPEQLATLERRAGRLSKFRHPHVAAVLGAGADGDGGFVVSEWVEGTDLTGIVGQAALTIDDFTTLARHTLDGLDAIHQHKLIHGSLKPNRIVLTWLPDQSVLFKITDLGLAELLGSADLVTTDYRGRYTGALDCLAPELFEGEPGDARSDLYAIGNVFYYALTQHLPFAADSADATIANHRAGNPLPIHDYRQDLPEPLAAWLMNLISHSPADRPQSVETARHSLEAALNGEAPALSAPTQVPPAATPGAEPEAKNEAATPAAAAIVAPDHTPSTKTAKVSVSASEKTESPIDSEAKAKATPARSSSKKSKNSWLPAAVVAVVAIGLGVFAYLKFFSASEPTASTPVGPASAAPLPAGATPATPAPLPGAATQSQAARPKSGELPAIDALLAQFAFDALEVGSTVAAVAPTEEWPKQSGLKAIASLRINGVDPESGSVARKIIATPNTFPALNGIHPLLQLTGKASMVVNWQRSGDEFRSGDQLTYIAVFWSPEKNANIIEFYPPIREEATIATRITDGQLVSDITHFDKTFQITPYPGGNQMLGFSLIWAGNQDNARHGILTSSGKRFTSSLSAAPNLSLLVSSIRLGGDTAPLVADRQSGVYFAELLVYDRALTPTERNAIDDYLALKYFP